MAILLPFLAMAAAQAVSAQPQESVIEGATTLNDNTRVTCMTISETGSRLARRRVCMTHAQWQESNRRNRALVQEAQIRQTVPTEMTAGQAAAALRGLPGPN